MIDLDGYETIATLAESETRVLLRARPAGGSGTVVVKLLRTEHPDSEDLARLRHEHAIAGDLPAEGFVRPLRVERFGRRAGLVSRTPGRLPGQRHPACGDGRHADLGGPLLRTGPPHRDRPPRRGRGRRLLGASSTALSTPTPAPPGRWPGSCTTDRAATRSFSASC